MKTSPSLLLVSYHALPSVTPGSLRVHWMSTELAKRGWTVALVTATPGAAAAPGARVEVAAAPQGPSRPARLRTLWNDYAIPDRYTLWGRHLRTAIARVAAEVNADVILSTSPPHSTHLPVRRARGRAKWVTDFRDPWTAPERQRRPRFSTLLQRRMERKVLLASDAVLANTEGNRRILLATFPELDAERVHVVPNAFDPPVPGDAAPVDDPADVTYVGEIYPGMVDRLVTAMTKLKGRPPRLAVYGHVDDRERAKIARAGLEGLVEYRGRVSHRESLLAMRRARSLLLLLPDGENWTSCVPSKLYPYLAAGRPVVAFVPAAGDAAHILRATGAGVVLDGDDAAGFDAFLARVRGAEAWTGRHEDVISQYGAPEIAARLDGVLRRVCEEGR